ncbi:MAG: hypothetical protein PHP37_02955 [Patescibacteria group bacterium]|nr:hypothetical protein [Patescibacteria group bacterium]
MEITITDIKKISKKFRIKEEDLINFIKNEERRDSIVEMRKKFLKEGKREILVEWAKFCAEFSEFEEVYVLFAEEIYDDFFINWVRSGKSYIERRVVLNCLPEENERLKKIIIKEWMDISKETEEIREIMSHLDPEEDLYKIGLKKIIKNMQ